MLLPLWRRVLDRLGIRAVVAMVARDPREAAASLHARDGWPEDLVLSLWARSVGAMLRNSEGLPRAVVAYTRLLANWRAEISHLARELEVPLPRTAANEAAIATALRTQC